MFVASLTDSEVDTLYLALKYWRHHRRESATRRNDRVVGYDELEILLAKLATARTTVTRPEEEDLSDLLSVTAALGNT